MDLEKELPTKAGIMQVDEIGLFRFATPPKDLAIQVWGVGGRGGGCRGGGVIGGVLLVSVVCDVGTCLLSFSKFYYNVVCVERRG